MLNLFSALNNLSLYFSFKCVGKQQYTSVAQMEADTKKSMEAHEQNRRRYARFLDS